MSERKQEKIGWIGGWTGGFVWVVVLSIILLADEQTFKAGTGFLIAGFGCMTIFSSRPGDTLKLVIGYRWHRSICCFFSCRLGSMVVGRLAADGYYRLVVCFFTPSDTHCVLADRIPALGRRQERITFGK